jgi:hypothetical protein
MNRKPKLARTETQSRRISINFRDSYLYSIFELGLKSLRSSQEKGIRGDAKVIQLISMCLNLIHQCLTYDFSASLDETLEEPSSNQVN